MSNTEQELLSELVSDLIERHPPFVLSADRAWDVRLWTDLVSTGLTALSDDDPVAAVPTAVRVLSGLARGAAAVPLAEHLLVARPTLAAAGLPMPSADEVVTFAGGGLTAKPLRDGIWLVSGVAVSPWCSIAEHVLLVVQAEDGFVVGLASPGDFEVRSNVNAAGEPRDVLVASSVPVEAVRVSSTVVDDFHDRFALARAAQLSGALQGILGLAIDYAHMRQQFGRSIGRFQAVQFMVADIAEEVALVASSVQSAANAVAAGRYDASTLIASAKINAGGAVAMVARNAHQIHGAIGFTQEHPLHHLTLRCWSWRDEAGTELSHAQTLSRTASTGDGPSAFWAHVTGTARTPNPGLLPDTGGEQVLVSPATGTSQ